MFNIINEIFKEIVWETNPSTSDHDIKGWLKISLLVSMNCLQDKFWKKQNKNKSFRRITDKK